MSKALKKIRRIGNSLGMVFPIDMLREVGWKEGDDLFLFVEEHNKTIRVEKAEKRSLFKKDN